jgi:putative colanic acid biosynthesis glycosyltransferase WcaI
MHYLIHEFGGYSFPVQLSRELASRGHYVTHVYPTGLPGPKGRLQKSPDDSERLNICALPLSGGFRKYSPLRRIVSQRKYASELKKLISRLKPDVVLSADTPIDIQAELAWHCSANDIGFVHWVQDVYCHAIEFFIRTRVGRWGAIASLMSAPFRWLEIAAAKRSDSVIAICPVFRDLYRDWGIPDSKIELLENWAPLDEIPARLRHNSWSKAHNLDGEKVFLYSGTLGLKHRPDLIYSLAKAVGGAIKVVVVSEGAGREYLERLPPLDNLLLLDFQPYSDLPDVLATADVLLAMLESDASRFAVPSKILSYLCAGRAVLLASPRSNLAGTVVERSGGGLVVDPDNTSQWIEAARLLASSQDYRLQLGYQARCYAEQAFDIQRTATAFEAVLLKSCKSDRSLVPSIQEVSSEIQN